MNKWRTVWFSVALLIGSTVGRVEAVVFDSDTTPVEIPTTPPGTFTTCKNITVPGPALIISDLNVRVLVSHPFIGDLTIRLTAPNASVLTLLNRPGRTGAGAGSDDNFIGSGDIFYNDQAAGGPSAENMGAGCADGTIGSTAGCTDVAYIPAPDAADTPAGVGTNLAQFNGLNAQGIWFGNCA